MGGTTEVRSPSSRRLTLRATRRCNVDPASNTGHSPGRRRRRYGMTNLTDAGCVRGQRSPPTSADRAYRYRVSSFSVPRRSASKGSVAYAMLFNVLHAEDAVSLLSEAFRILRPDGMLGIIHWVHDAGTPRGPDLSIRPRPEQCSEWASQAGFVSQQSSILLPPYHYGLVMRKLG